VRSLREFGESPVQLLAQSYDLLIIDHPHVGSAAASGSLLALDEFLSVEELSALSARSIGGSHGSYQFAGHQWALAIDGAAQVSASRLDLLADAPQNWEEVVDLARLGKVLWPLNPTDASCSFMSLMAQQGTSWPGEAIIPSTEAIESVLNLIATIGSHLPTQCLVMNPIQTLNELTDPSTSYFYCPLLFGYSNYSRNKFRARRVSFADMPTLAGGAPVGSILGGAGIAISSRVDNPQAAVAYASWIASGSCQANLYTTSGGQPAHLDAWDSLMSDEQTGNFFTATRATLDNAWIRPRDRGFVEIQTRVGDIVNRFLSESLPIAKVSRELTRLAKIAHSDD
jgi:multiple sugar transport system substrate-binding protein